MTANNEPTHIEPVDFRGGRPQRRRGRGWLGRLVGLLALLLVACLAVAAWFVFTAQRTTIRVEPAPDRISIDGPWPRVRLGDQVLLRRGSYTVTAQKTGYHDGVALLTVTREVVSLELQLEKLPGRVLFRVHAINAPDHEVPDPLITVDGGAIVEDPAREFSLTAGYHTMDVRAERYLPYKVDFAVEGMDRRQDVAVGLTPAWSDVEISAIPDHATLTIDGIPYGPVPVRLELLAGSYDLLFEAENYNPLQTQLVVQANTPMRLEGIELMLADAFVELESVPDQALVTVDGTFRGKTPLRIPVRPNEAHRIEVTTPGYRPAARDVQLSPKETQTVSLELEPILAVVRLNVEPADTELFVDGASRGATPAEVSLSADSHQIEIRKEGFEPYRTTITPKVDFAQELVVRLKSPVPGRSAQAAAAAVRSSSGHELRLIEPGVILMGSSRREQGRRSNETLRRIELRRPFYMGAREVTNAEFRAFKPGHNSGMIQDTTLNRDEQPVVNVKWEDAAAYCNWLSLKEGLEPVYEQREETFVAKQPIPNGYRLPTESEWAYCARRTKSGGALKFPWGDDYPPTTVSGNYGDTAVKNILANYLPDYHDGMAVSGPPGSFPPNEFGLYDLGGNVAEWCHDPYEIYSNERDRVFVDPVGPPAGDLHVIRGSSWKRSSMSTLRLSYRDYGNEGRNDVGFRLCRYANEPETP